jgi:hypothetical protein
MVVRKVHTNTTQLAPDANKTPTNNTICLCLTSTYADRSYQNTTYAMQIIIIIRVIIMKMTKDEGSRNKRCMCCGLV